MQTVKVLFCGGFWQTFTGDIYWEGIRCPYDGVLIDGEIYIEPGDGSGPVPLAAAHGLWRSGVLSAAEAVVNDDDYDEYDHYKPVACDWILFSDEHLTRLESLRIDNAEDGEYVYRWRFNGIVMASSGKIIFHDSDGGADIFEVVYYDAGNMNAAGCAYAWKNTGNGVKYGIFDSGGGLAVPFEHDSRDDAEEALKNKEGHDVK